MKSEPYNEPMALCHLASIFHWLHLYDLLSPARCFPASLAFQCLKHFQPFASLGPFYLLFLLPGTFIACLFFCFLAYLFMGVSLTLFKSRFNVMLSGRPFLIFHFKTASPSLIQLPPYWWFHNSMFLFPSQHPSESIFSFIWLFSLPRLHLRLHEDKDPATLNFYDINS